MGKDKRITIKHRGRKWMVVGKMFEPFADSGFGKLGCMLATLDEEKILCHECGETYKHLGPHLKAIHKMNSQKYRDNHSLLMSQSLASPKQVEFHREVTLKTMKKHPHLSQNFKAYTDAPRIGAMACYNSRARQRIGSLNKRGVCPPQIEAAFVLASKKYQGDFGQVLGRELPHNIYTYLMGKYRNFNSAKRELFGVNGIWGSRKIWQNERQVFDAVKKFVDVNRFFPRLKDFWPENDLPSPSTLRKSFGTSSLVKLRDLMEANGYSISSLPRRYGY